jgi:leucyl-tRNA---protein transferase
MFAEAHAPETLHPEELDAYLQKGWFRMGQTIFTTNFLHFKSQFYSAIWLRIILAEFCTDKKQKRIFKLNSSFRTEIKQASIDQQKEDLYGNYKLGISFEASPSLRYLLFGATLQSIYNTYEVNVYDNNKLIATGYFDIGSNSAAGITCFYDHGYKKYSLGKYLIYLKIEYCKRLGLEFFYPGYFVPGYALFDYKLEIGRSGLEYLQFTQNKWFSIENFSQVFSPLQVMSDKLHDLHVRLSELKISSSVLKYEFFDANLIPELKGMNLVDFPLFLCFAKSTEDSIDQMIVYDVRDECYHLIKCHAVLKTSPANKSSDTYSAFALKIERTLFSTATSEEMVIVLLMEVRHQLSGENLLPFT